MQECEYMKGRMREAECVRESVCERYACECAGESVCSCESMRRCMCKNVRATVCVKSRSAGVGDRAREVCPGECAWLGRVRGAWLLEPHLRRSPPWSLAPTSLCGAARSLREGGKEEGDRSGPSQRKPANGLVDTVGKRKKGCVLNAVIKFEVAGTHGC